MAAVPTLKEMTEQLIATPSVSSTLTQFDQSNLDVVHSLANWLEPLGFQVDIHPLPDRPGKANLIATRGQGKDGLVLSGHTDTVPFDAHLWQNDPFTLTEKDDRWYGLGTCDMKSFFALAIAALEPLANKPFEHPLILLATADEESSMSGARALQAAELSNARFAMIGEPTALMPVNRHKGIMMLAVTLEGHSGHSSNPALGKNALEGAGVLIGELMTIRDELRAKYRHPAFEVAFPTLNLGCINGGDNPNRICDHVTLEFDVRVLPGMNNEQIRDEISRRLVPKFEAAGMGCRVELLYPPVPPFEGAGEDMLSALRKLSGQEATAVAFATEAPFLSQLGMETIVMGPGSIDQAHQPNEYIELNQLEPTIGIIRRLIRNYCLAEE